MVLDRLERLLEQRGERDLVPSQQEIDDLYTDACAAVLVLEGERLGIERHLAGASGTGCDELARRREQTDAELSALKSLSRFLRTAAEWSRDPASKDLPALNR